MNVGSIENSLDLRIIPGEIEPLFWPSKRPDHESAWHGHVSFAHWLVAEVQPGSILELGTHNGVSFSAFCNAVKRSGLTTKCFAVDSWQGDSHAGNYGEAVFEDIKSYIDKEFQDFATLLRMNFDDALHLIPDKSLDILHIDGLHTYDAVRHDFYSWLPKISSRGVVLFHDTDVRRADFGVWQFWSELTKR